MRETHVALVRELLRANLRPEALQISTGSFWSEVVKWININFFDELEAVKNALLLNVMIPFKRFLLGLPWLGVTLLLGLLGYALAGWRLGLIRNYGFSGDIFDWMMANGLWPLGDVLCTVPGV